MLESIYGRGGRKVKILVVNPVVGDQWTEQDRAYLQGIVDPGTEVEVVGLTKGPRSIETFYDEAHAAPDILRVIREKEEKVSAIVVNCFADPAVDAAREITDKPVLGPAATSMSIALHLGAKFSVISILPNTAACVEQQAVKLGLERRLASAIGIDVPVLELEKDPAKTVEAIVRAARTAVEQDGAEVIILGCTGMATLAAEVRKKLDIPVIEPAATTVKVAEALVKLGLHHHRGRSYLPPSFDKIVGYD